MTSKLRIEPPEAMCHLMNRGDQNEPPQTLSQAQEVLPLCK
jgi:hypothetical protein